MNELTTISKYWAIEPDALKNIFSTIRERQPNLSLFSMESKNNNKGSYDIKNGVAIIDIQGVITPRADLFTSLFGGTSLESIQENIKSAIENKEVKSILLNVDSPGGVALGTSETAEIINTAKDKKRLN